MTSSGVTPTEGGRAFGGVAILTSSARRIVEVQEKCRGRGRREEEEETVEAMREEVAIHVPGILPTAGA